MQGKHRRDKSSLNNPQDAARTPKLQFFELESRLMFSASPLGEPVEPIDAGLFDSLHADISQWFDAESANQSAVEIAIRSFESLDSTSATSRKSAPGELANDLQLALAVDDLATESDTARFESPENLDDQGSHGESLLALAPAEFIDSQQHFSKRLELVVIDSSVEDFETLVEGIQGKSQSNTRFEFIIIEREAKGIDALSLALSDHDSVDAIHLIAHSDGSNLRLGQTSLSTDNFSDYQNQIYGWQYSMAANADLLIYGCDLAGNEQGQQLIDSLAATCACDVAASDDLTGHQSLGGDWDLEFTIGSIETQIAFSTQTQDLWQSVLVNVTFQEGVASYTGTQDTEIWEDDPSTSFGSQTTISVDPDNSGGESQGLVRFDNIFGSGTNQIPFGATINSATLTLEVTDDTNGTISLHRMLANWDENSTWNSMTNGIQLDDSEALSVADRSQSGSGTGSQVFTGLASALQAWSDGSTNDGWVIVNDNNNGFDFRTSETATSSERPLLTVDYTPHTITVDTANDVLDGDADTSSLAALIAAPGADGFISLREAIIAANTQSGADTILFGIAGAGPHTISVTSSQLPTISETLTIDATSQPGYSGSPLIEIEGSALGSADGLTISAANTVIRGLAINRFLGDGIFVGADNVTIEDNYIGTNVAGTADLGNLDDGIEVTDNGVIIRDNLISGNDADGIQLNGADAALVTGNIIGLDITGMIDLGNDDDGIQVVSGGSLNTIGGNTAALRNLISGNDDDGIEFAGSGSGNIAIGNYIGTDINGNDASVGNNSDGIELDAGISGSQIGGTGVNEGNLIAFNVAVGVHLTASASDGNTIRGNRIHSNIDLGIDISAGTENGFGVTSNDLGDGDSGPNQIQNFPSLTSVVTGGGNTTFVGNLNSNASTAYQIDFYSGFGDPSGHGEGVLFLGSDTIVTNGSGDAAFNITLPITITVGAEVSAIVTDPSGNSSEFGLSATSVLNNASGVVYSDQGVTPLGNQTVRVAINGVDQGTVESNATTGAYSFSGLSINSNDIVTVYLEDESANAVAIIKSDGNPITTDLYQDRLIVGRNGGGAITDIEVSNGRVNSESDISEIYQFTVGGTAMQADTELIIATGSTLTLTDTLSVHDIEIDGTLDAGADAINVSGSWQNDGAADTTGLVSFTGSGAETVDTGGTGTGNDFQSIQLNKSGGTLTLTANDLEFDGSITLSAGTLDVNGQAITGLGAAIVVGGGNLDVSAAASSVIADTVAVNAGLMDVAAGTLTSTTFLQVSGTGSVTSSSGTFNIGTQLIINGGSLLAGAADIDVGTDVNISNGSLTAPSSGGSFQVTGNWTRTGGSFSNNSGTVEFVGGGATVVDSLGFESFSSLTINKTGGASFSIAAGDDIGVQSLLTLNDGVYTAASGDLMHVSGNVVVGSAWDGGNGELRFEGASNQTFDLTGATGNFDGDIRVNKTAGRLDLLSDLVLDGAGQDLRVELGQFDLNGFNLDATTSIVVQNNAILRLQGNESFLTTLPTIDFGSTVTYDGSGIHAITDLAYHNLIFDGTGIFNLGSSESVAGNFTVTNGTVNLAGNTLAITGNFMNLASGTVTTGGATIQLTSNWNNQGLFAHSNGLVELVGTNQQITGTTTFYDLNKTVAGADLLLFESGSTQTIDSGGTLTLKGAAANALTLNPTGAGDFFLNVNAAATQDVRFVSVFGSDASPGATVTAWNSTDSGSNLNWQFGNFLVVDTAADENDGNTSSINALIATPGGTGISLREAMIAANNTTNATVPDEIRFGIAGAGPHTIIVDSSGLGALPGITEAVVIDGTTQSGAALGTLVSGSQHNLLIELQNDVIGAADGLVITSAGAGSTIRGLVINSFSSAIELDGGFNTIEGNYIGTNVAGTAALRNGFNGIYIDDSANNIIINNLLSGNNDGADDEGIYISGSVATGNQIRGNIIGLNAAGDTALGNYVGILIEGGATGNTIGGSAATDRNIISGNANDGVIISGIGTDNNILLGNYIGTNLTGTIALGNLQDGIQIETSGNIIGGSNPGEGNVISGNTLRGIILNGTAADSNIIRGNRIGTDAGGTGNLGNGSAGIRIQGTADNNTIGGVGAGDANTIAFNGGDGVFVSAGTGNSIRGNSIHSNSELGIDLGVTGVTNNDVGDGDTGANNLQNFPLVFGASSSAGFTTITGSFNSTASSTFTVDYYSVSTLDVGNHGEGETYLGSQNITTDGSGNAAINFGLAAAVTSGHFITATLTDVSGNTSEFSAGTYVYNYGSIVVDSATDVADGNTSSISALYASKGADGFISLREAIIATNNTANGASADRIWFTILGSGPHTFSVATAMPSITDAVFIDGRTEPNYSAGTPVIELDGTLSSGVNGLTLGLGADNSTLRALIVNNFDGDGISITSSVTGATISGNWIGIDSDGITPAANGNNGILVNGFNNLIGGTVAEDRNVVSGNAGDGIAISGAGATGNQVHGNYIGTNASFALLGNGGAGVHIFGGASNNEIGGLSVGELPNFIHHNAGDGVWVESGSGNAIRSNSIRDNIGLGIDLGIDGVSINDTEDGDSGANELLNYPVLTNVFQDGADLDIDFELDLPAGTYRIEFFDTAGNLDPSGHGEGGTFIGFATVTATGAAGNEPFSTTLSSVTASDVDNITVTATLDLGGGSFGSTSEFGPHYQSVGVLVVDTTADENDGDTSSIAALIASPGGTGISLREAIIAANNTVNGGSPDEIHFNIAGAGPHSISISAGGLPNITDSLIIDGWTEPDWVSTPVIELDGSAAGAVDGLYLIGSASDGSTIRGIAINRFGQSGIAINDSDNNFIHGNHVGTDVSGTTDLGNAGHGIALFFGASNNQIGGSSGGEGNVISGNDANGLNITDAGTSGNVVSGNIIGLDVTGTIDLGNTLVGVAIALDADANVIGTVGSGRNVISGNDQYGIRIVDTGTDNNVVQNNYIGLQANGTAANGNSGDGIRVESAGALIGTVIGGTTAGLGNVIGGNSGDGIEIRDGVTNTTIAGNIIGTNAAGTSAITNFASGIYVLNSDNNTIGGTTLAERNLISGNSSLGIFLFQSDNNTIQGNYIGTEVTGSSGLKNDGGGILVGANSDNNLIGGINAGAGNLIAFNDEEGVTFSSSAGAGNAILSNSIHSNQRVGIDHCDNGNPTNNDAEDVDSGSNDLLNFPVLTNVSQNGADLDIDVSLDLAAGNYRIEYFDNPSGLDGSGFGEGEILLGFSQVTVAGNAGYELFSITLGSTTPSAITNVTATVTEADGTFTVYSSTSEFSPQFAGAGVLTVTTTNDTNDGDTSSITALLGNRGADGEISLREAIIATNNSVNIGGNPDEIQFNIADSGPHTISIGSALPIISEALVIDGSSEPDFAGSPVIELDGSLAGGGVDGLTFNAASDGSTVRSLAINSFNGAGIRLNGDNHTIVGNFIGLDVDGATAAVNIGSGIFADASSGLTIGGASAGDRNIISGNTVAGVYFQGVTGSTIEGNYIGTDSSGLLDRGNGTDGIHLTSASANNTIGGTSAAERNVIAANTSYGISISGTSSNGNTIHGNYIGTDSTGAGALGNGLTGIEINNASSTIVGGINPGESNVIAFNGAHGVQVLGASAQSNSIRGNSIHSNTDLAINLNGGSEDGFGVTANDAGDVDGNPNALQNYPVLISSVTTGGNTTIQGTINSTASTTIQIDFYSAPTGDPSGFGEGQVYLGSDSVVTDGSGNASINTTLVGVSVTVGHAVSATATNALGNTSEFANGVTAAMGSNILVVDTTSDVSDGDTSSITNLIGDKGADGFISLREAIIAANNTANGGSPDEIQFNIAGGGPHTISVVSALPDIQEAVIIDGSTEPDFAGSPIIELDGSGAGFADGFVLMVGSDGSTIRGFVINRFGDDGIQIDSNNNTIAGNYVGLNVTGTAAAANTFDGIRIDGGSNNTIGGLTALDRNVISGNGDDGIQLQGIATGNVVIGNYIGTNAAGNSALGNGDAGIEVSSTASANTIGGTTAAARNVISGNTGTGITLNGADGHQIQGNYIGTDVSGTVDLGNGAAGIHLLNSAATNTIGGAIAGAGNLISGNAGDGILISGANSDSNVIAGNLIGTNFDGSTAIQNDGLGIFVDGASHNITIGGLSAAERNVIAGNAGGGITLRDSTAGTNHQHQVIGNFIGVDAAGTSVLANVGSGVSIVGADQITIGGAAAGAANVLSGNTLYGVRIIDGNQNSVLGNFIGTDPGNTLALGNLSGIQVQGNSSNTTIGGIAAGEGNIIRHNASDGVYVLSSTTTGVSIRGNSISDNSFGIDLDGGDMTPNDPGDADTGPNDLQNFPDLLQASSAAGFTTIVGSINSSASSTFDLDFYSTPTGDPSGFGQGAIYLGSATVVTDGSGNAEINFGFSVAVSAGHAVTAAATDASGNTSEFSNWVATTNIRQIVVDTTNDVLDGDTSSISALYQDKGADGFVSLREAITAANNTANVGSPDEIHFNIAGGGPHTIVVGSMLPIIQDAVVIDGWSEPDFVSTPIIELDGSSAGAVSGIDLGVGSDGSTIRGLVVNRFGGTAGAIDIRSDNNTIVGNYIGTDVSGTTALANGRYGIQVRGDNNMIGGSTPLERNVISGNNSNEIHIDNGHTNIIQGNYIGTAADGFSNLGAGFDGIHIFNGSSNNVIGGVAAGEGNIIAFQPADGVTVTGAGIGNTIRGNSIHSNGQLGIELANDGVTTNDPGDLDAGPNNLKNYPVLTSATVTVGSTTIVGSINSTASALMTIDFYSSPTGDPSGHGEGQVYLGSDTVMTDGSGNATINTTLVGVSVTLGHAVTATTTGPGGSTSEFANGVTAQSTTTLVVDTTSDLADGDTSSIANLLSNRGADGFISLREAIIAANNTTNAGSPDEIHFNIAGAGPHSIQLTSVLPSITEAIVIDGSSEPDFAGTPVVELDGLLAGGGTHGLVLAPGSDGSTIRGLAIHSFGNDGIVILSSNNHQLLGNYLGTDSTGFVALGNGDDGIFIGGANNIIGGTSAADRNVIVGNSDNGIEIAGTGATNNSVIGNYIGVDVSGTAALGNSAAGIRIYNSASNNLIGGISPGAGNVISANQYGVYIHDTGTDANQLSANTIGLNALGNTDLGNTSHGVFIAGGATNTQIGGISTADRNFISGNNGSGVFVQDAPTTGTLIRHNFIGTSANGMSSIGNSAEGITISDSANTTIGGTLAGVGLGNVISGNNFEGVLITGNSATGNVVQANVIGIDALGLSDLANGLHGVHLSSGASNNVIGGTAIQERNVISGNLGEGILINGLGTDGNIIQGNFIGTDLTGSAGIPNIGDGIQIDNGASNNLIGGTSTAERNVIAFNSNAGVAVQSGTGNSILGNSIAHNGALGIDLPAPGVTSNDPGDADAGANNLQNFPLIQYANSDGVGNINLIGNLLSNPSTSYRIEFFASSLEDPSVHGEGERFIGIVNVTTNGGGVATFNVNLNAVVSDGEYVSATATVDLGGGNYSDTSEFAQNIQASTINNAPIVTAPPSPLNATEQTSLAIEGTGFSVYDVDEAAQGAIATITVGEGTITVVSGSSGVSIDSGNGSTSVQINGTIAQINNLLTGSGTGSITYLNNGDDPTASTSITVTVNDQGNVGTDPGLTGDATSEEGSASQIINISAINDPPALSANLPLNTNEGATTAITTALLNEADPDDNGTELVYSVIGGLFNGQLELLTNPGVAVFNFTQADVDAGMLVYVHDDSETTSDYFDFSLADGGEDGALPILARFNINVTLVNDNPVTPIVDLDGTPNQASENSVIGSLVGITSFASDADTGTTISYSLLDDAGGRFSIDSNSGEIQVANGALLDFEVDPFHDVTVRAQSSDGSFADQVFTINVLDVNEQPVAIDDFYTVPEDQSLAPSVGVMANDLEPDGDVLTITIINGPARAASFNLNPDGTFSYQPEANYFGSDQFDYQIDDGRGGTSIARVNIDVASVNDAPLANPDHYSVLQTFQLIELAGVLINDMDVEGDVINAILLNGPANGNVSLNSDGTFTYTPDANFFGIDQFRYLPSDAMDQGLATTVSIEVVPIDGGGSDGGNNGGGSNGGGGDEGGDGDSGDSDDQGSGDDNESNDGSGGTSEGGNNTDSGEGSNGSPLSDILPPSESDRSNSKADSLPANLGSGTQESILGKLDVDANSRLLERLMSRLTRRADDGQFELKALDRDLDINKTRVSELGSVHFDYQLLNRRLNALEHDVNQGNGLLSIDLEIAAAASTGIATVGYVLWSLRGSVLVATLLSSMPTWKLIDPLPILDGRTEFSDDDDETLQSIIEKSNEK